MKNKILRIERGYLNKDFEIFHLKDKKNINFEFHYHNFSKIVVFISGNVTYLIEGKSYKLRPWDILLVSKNDIHRAVIDPYKTYERIILWINPNFLIQHNNNCDLLSCFKLASRQKFNLLRLNSSQLSNIKRLIFNIEDTSSNIQFGYEVLRTSLFLQLIVYINRLFADQKNLTGLNGIVYDKNINNILNYINDNLDKSLSIDLLASKFYLSKYYLMHKFKEQTGYTIHNYILQKRLIMSNSLIENGESITNACIKSGFQEYSSFVRAFKKMFGLSPKNYHNQQPKI
ncbi:AraC family transcriptional regulator [Clostridium sp. LBM24168]